MKDEKMYDEMNEWEVEEHTVVREKKERDEKRKEKDDEKLEVE